MNLKDFIGRKVRVSLEIGGGVSSGRSFRSNMDCSARNRWYWLRLKTL